jgi:hypothetical protein
MSEQKSSRAKQSLMTCGNRSSGPKTDRGKQRTKLNATKHGIFSRHIVVEGENRLEFESLLQSLLNCFQPQSIVEDFFVEKLAHDFWRYRRFTQVEQSECEQSARFVEWDKENQQIAEAEKICSSRLEVQVEGGLILHISNPEILDRCLNLLIELRERIQERGFQEEDDSRILENIYGTFVNSG